MRRAWAIMAVCLLCGCAWGATYYVSASGADTNNGTSAETAWAHHPWDANATNTAQSTVLAAGDTVYLRRGDTWFNCQLSSNDAGGSGNPIVTTSSNTFYASSASDPLPRLSGAVDPSTITWTNTSGTIYSMSLAAAPNIVCYDDVVLTADTGTSATSGKYFWADGTLYVNVGESPDAGVFEVPSKSYVNLTSANYQSFSYLTFGACYGVATAFVNGQTGITYDHCTFMGTYQRAVYGATASGGGLRVTNCTFPANATKAGSGTMIDVVATPGVVVTGNTIVGATSKTGVGISSNSDDAVVTGNTISGCTYGVSVATGTTTGYEISGNSIHDNATYGILVQTAGSGEISGNSVYNNNNVANAGAGINLVDSNSNQVYGNTVYSNGRGNYGNPAGYGSGIRLDGSSESNEVYRNNCYSNYVGIYVVTTSGDENVISYNVVRDSTVNSIDIQATGTTGWTYIYNNTVIHNPSANNLPAYTGHAISLQVNGKRAKFANNLVVIEQSGTNCEGLTISDYYTEVWTDYNLLYDATGGNSDIGLLNADRYSELGAWQAACAAETKLKGLDGSAGTAESHTIAVNPLLVSLNGNDFQLTETSPAIDAATSVGLSLDMLGVSVPQGDGVDIGAYEWTVGVKKFLLRMN